MQNYPKFDSDYPLTPSQVFLPKSLKSVQFSLRVNVMPLASLV